jgi:hypothetical protein
VLVVLWSEKGIKGSRDLIPIEWLIPGINDPDVTHKVFGPRGYAGIARCAVKVADNALVLDYGGIHSTANDENWELGRLKIQFLDGELSLPIRVFWRDDGHRQFKPALATAAFEDDTVTSDEGSSCLVWHLRRERNPALVRAKIECEKEKVTRSDVKHAISRLATDMANLARISAKFIIAFN